MAKACRLMTLTVCIAIILLSGYALAAPLHDAAKEGDLEKVKSLIAEGADVNVKDDNGATPLHTVATIGHIHVAGLFPTTGTDVTAQAKKGATVDYIGVVELLISKGADVNAKTKTGSTPLHWASNKDIAELLITKGADVDAANKMGRTPLWDAARSGYKEVAELLITKGANVNAADNRGSTPFRAANARGHKDIAELIRKHGGK